MSWWRNRKWTDFEALIRVNKMENNSQTEVLDENEFFWIFTINLLNVGPHCLILIIYEWRENAFKYVVPISSCIWYPP